MGPPFDRRLFLKRLGLAGMGAGAASALGFATWDQWRYEPPIDGGAGRVRDFARGLDRGPAVLSVGRGDPAAATRAAIRGLGGMGRFVRPGEVVAIKPNAGWDRTPVQAANTDPAVVGALVTLCLEAGASRVVVTDNPCNDAGRCFTRSGIWAATEAAGGEILLPAAHRFAPYDLGGAILGRMPVLVPALGADRFINVAKAKHHGLSGFTGAMKNLYGVLGGRRDRLHQAIDESIADLAAFLRATLTVLDATRVLLRNGPQGGDVADTREVKEVVASIDPVAVDAYGCTLVDLALADVPYIGLAARRGLGTADPAGLARKEGA